MTSRDFYGLFHLIWQKQGGAKEIEMGKFLLRLNRIVY